MTLYQRMHPEPQQPTEYHDEIVATGPVLVNDEMICSTCGRPAYVYSPDFDSAEVRHGPVARRSPWVQMALANELKAKVLA